MPTRRFRSRRSLLLGLAAVGLVPLSGCTSKPLRPVEADGRYCHRIGKSYKPTLTCTPGPVPSAAEEAEVKRFAATPELLTVYVLRNRWSDTLVTAVLAVDGIDRATTIPVSLVRITLKPGMHRLSVRWDAGASDFGISGMAGEVRFVELNGREWAWSKGFSWRAADAQEVRARALAAKLVADLELGR